MKRTAKIRFLAWLMIVCLILPDLSLDAYADSFRSDDNSDSYSEAVSDDDVDSLAAVLEGEDLQVTDLSAEVDMVSAIIRGKVKGYSRNMSVSVEAIDKTTKVGYASADYSKENGVFYKYDTDFSIVLDKLVYDSPFDVQVSVNGRTKNSIFFKTLPLTEDSRQIKIDDYSIEESGKTTIAFTATGSGYSREGIYVVIFRQLDDEGNVIKSRYQTVQCNYDLKNKRVTGVAEIGDGKYSQLIYGNTYKIAVACIKNKYTYLPQTFEEDEYVASKDEIEVKVEKTEPHRKITLESNSEHSSCNSYIAEYRVAGVDNENHEALVSLYLWDEESKSYKENDNAIKGNKIVISDLKPSTEYKYALTVSANYGPDVFANDEDIKANSEDAQFASFKTLDDDRSVELLTLKEKIEYNSYEVKSAVKGSSAALTDLNPLYAVYKYKTGDGEWSERIFDVLKNQEEIKLEGLKDNTKYDYSFIVKRNKEDDDSKAVYSKTGSFTTLKNDNVIEILKGEEVEEIGAYHYSFAFRVNGKAANAGAGCKYAVYCKKSSDKDYKLLSVDDAYIGGEPTEVTIKVPDAATKYDYKIVLLTAGATKENAFEGENVKTDFVKDTKTGSFQTVKDDRKLSATKVVPRKESAEYTLKVDGSAAKVEPEANFAVLYREKGSKDNYSFSESSMVYPENKRWMITGLKNNTEYEYLLLLTKTKNSVDYIDLASGNLKALDELSDKQKVYANGYIISSTAGSFKTTDTTSFIELYNENIGATHYSTNVRINGVNGIEEKYPDSKIAMNIKSAVDSEYSNTLLEIRTGDTEKFSWYKLSPESEYEYTVWYLANDEVDSNGDFKNVILKRTGTFKSLPDDRKLILKNEEVGAYSYNAEVGVTGKAFDTDIIYNNTNAEASVYYKKVTDEDYQSYSENPVELTFEADSKNKFNIRGLEEDTEYEYKIILYQHKIQIGEPLTGEFKTLIDDRKPALKESVIGRNEAKLTFEVEGKTAKIDKKDAVVGLYYKKSSEKEWSLYSTKMWNWDDENDEGMPVIFDIRGLEPGTIYNYKASVLKDAEIDRPSTYPKDVTELIDKNTLSAQFETATDERVLVLVADSVVSRLNSISARFFVQNVNEEIDFKDIDGNEIEDPTCRLVIRYKDAKSKEWKYVDTVYHFKDVVNTGTIVFDNLLENTEYTIEGIIVDSYEGTPIDKIISSAKFNSLGTISTIKEDRAVVLSDCELTPYEFNGTFELTGKAAIENTNWLFVWKNDQGDWVVERNTTDGTSFTSTFNMSELKTGNKYNYKLAVGKNVVDAEELVNAKLNAEHRMADGTYVLEGTIVAPQETRTIGDTSIITGFTFAKVTGRVENNYLGINTTLYLFYKEKGSYTWNYDAYSSSEGSFVHTFELGNLEQGKEYEYVFAIFKNGERVFMPDNAEFKDVTVASKNGEFKTDTADYTIDFSMDENGATYDSLDITASLKSEQKNDSLVSVKAYLLKKDDNDINNAIVVENKFSPFYKDFSNDLLFEGLEANTTYKIVQADISALENNRFVKVLTIEDINAEFKTLPANVSKITLKTDLDKLNIGQKGYDETTVEVVVPEGEASDVIFTVSGNQSGIVRIVETTKDTITLVGAKSGNVKVMAVSKYNDKVKAEISLSVADIRLYSVDPEGKEQRVMNSDESIVIFKDLTQGFKLYSYEGSKETPVKTTENATFSMEGIISGGEAGADIKFTGVTSGYSDVTLVYNGYKVGFSALVKAKAVGYALTGFEPLVGDRAAVYDSNEDEYIVAYENGAAFEYMPKLIATPDKEANVADNKEFYWKSSNENIIKVDKDGKLTILRADSEKPVTITCTPKDENISPIQFNVRALEIPYHPADSYVYSNLKVKKLSDVRINSGVAGWEWVNPSTSLESLKVGEYGYFNAKYTGKTYYPETASVLVEYGTIDGLVIDDDGHNHVLELSADGKDDILYISSSIKGKNYSSSDFEVIFTSKNSLYINSFDYSAAIQANKTGSYTVEATLYHKATNTKVASAKYKFTVVKESIASRVVIEGYKDNVLVAMVDTSKNVNEKVICSADDKKDIKLVATAYDYSGKKIEDVKYSWSVTDKKVASISKGNNEITVKSLSEGNAFVNVKVHDKRGITEQIAVEIRNYVPKFAKTKFDVNYALDYSSAKGRAIAADNGGLVSIAAASAYDGDQITSVELYDDEACTTLAKDMMIVAYNEGKYAFNTGRYLLVPQYTDLAGAKNEFADGTKKYYVKVTTKKINGKDVIPVSIDVNIKASLPTIKAKTSKKLNLFYTNDTGSIKFTSKNLDSTIKYLEWDDGHSTVSENMTELDLINNNSFVMGYDKIKNEGVIYQNYIKTKINGKKIVPNGTKVSGTINVYLDGYKDPVKINNFKIGYTYKAAKLQVKYLDKFKSVCTMLGMNENSFTLYDKTQKTALFFDADADGLYRHSTIGEAAVNMINSSNENLKILNGSEYIEDEMLISCEYLSKKKSEKAKLDVFSNQWRNAANVKYTLKDVKPKATLAKTKLVFNTKYSSVANDEIIIKNVGPCVELSKVDIKPLGKSASVLSQNALEINVSVDNGSIEIAKNHESEVLKVPNGKYSFSFTPSVAVVEENTDASENDAGSAPTKTEKKLNSVKLKLTITDKLPTIKAKASGKIDLLKLSSYIGQYNPNNPATYSDCRISVQEPKNMIDGAYSYNTWFEGEYRNCFEFVYNNRERGYLVFLNDYGKCKAKFNYKFKVLKDIRFISGENANIESKEFGIKTVQKNPKIKVNGTAELYASSDSYAAVVDITGPKGYALWYAGCSNTIDVVKDKYNDFNIYYYYDETTGKGTITIRLNNFDGVVANKKYKLPIYLQFVGTDGIQKGVNVKVNTILHR